MWTQISDSLIEFSFSMYTRNQSFVGVYVYPSHLGVAHIYKFTLMDAQDTKIFNDE